MAPRRDRRLAVRVTPEEYGLIQAAVEAIKVKSPKYSLNDFLVDSAMVASARQEEKPVKTFKEKVRAGLDSVDLVAKQPVERRAPKNTDKPMTTSERLAQLRDSR